MNIHSWKSKVHSLVWLGHSGLSGHLGQGQVISILTQPKAFAHRAFYNQEVRSFAQCRDPT